MIKTYFYLYALIEYHFRYFVLLYVDRVEWNNSVGVVRGVTAGVRVCLAYDVG